MRSIAVRLLTLVLSLSFFIFSGCSENRFSNEKTSPQEPGETTVQEPTEKIVVLPTCSKTKMNIYRAIFQETGHNPVMEYSFDAEQQIYTDVKLNAYYATGFGRYLILSEEEYNNIQDYQNRTGIQVIYPTVSFPDRKDRHEKYRYDANIFYQTENSHSIIPVLDQNGDFVPNYWMYAVDSKKSTTIAEYSSIRVEGESGVNIDGVNYYYVYARKMDYKMVEVRVFRYEYYEYLKQTQPENLPSEDLFFDLD